MNARILLLLFVLIGSSFSSSDALAQSRTIDTLTTEEVRNAVWQFLNEHPLSPALKDVGVSPGAIVYEAGQIQWPLLAAQELGERALTQSDRALRTLLKQSMQGSGLLSRNDLTRFQQLVDRADIRIQSAADRPPARSQAPSLVPSTPSTPAPPTDHVAEPRSVVPPNTMRPEHPPLKTVDTPPVEGTAARSKDPCRRSADAAGARAEPVSAPRQSPVVTADSISAAVARHFQESRRIVAAPSNSIQLVSQEEQSSAASDGGKRAAASIYFSEGYHAYWRRDYHEALDHIDNAIRLDGADARYWYFKGLAEMALGNNSASDSFAQAILLELQGKPDSQEIGQSLTRVQGPIRRQLQTAKLSAQRLSTLNGL